MKVCSTVYCYGSNFFFSIYVNVRCKYFGTCQIRALHGMEPQKSQEWAGLSMGLMVSLLCTNIRNIYKFPVYFNYLFIFFFLVFPLERIACQWLKWKEISTNRYEILLRSNQMQMSLTRTRCIPSSSSEILFPNIFLSYFLLIADAVDYTVMRITERLQLPFIRAICGTYSQRWWPPSRRNENERKKAREKERKRLVWRIMQGGFDGCLEAQNEIHSNVKFKLTYLILWAHTHLRTHAYSADVWNELRQLIFK